MTCITIKNVCAWRKPFKWRVWIVWKKKMFFKKIYGCVGENLHVCGRGLVWSCSVGGWESGVWSSSESIAVRKRQPCQALIPAIHIRSSAWFIIVGERNCVILRDLHAIWVGFQARPLVIREGHGEECFWVTNKLVHVPLTCDLCKRETPRVDPISQTKQRNYCISCTISILANRDERFCFLIPMFHLLSRSVLCELIMKHQSYTTKSGSTPLQL